MNGDSLDLRQLHEIGELPIGSHQDQPLQRPRAGAQRFAHRMQPVDQIRRTIASSDWCRRACLR